MVVCMGVNESEWQREQTEKPWLKVMDRQTNRRKENMGFSECLWEQQGLDI